MSLKNLTPDEMTYCKTAVANYKRLENITLDGDMYRLVSPYEGNHTATMYVGDNKNKAVLYAFDIHPRFQEKMMPVKLQGLDPTKNYKIEEINQMPRSKGDRPMMPPMMPGNEGPKIYSGDYLMKVGLNVFSTMQTTSHMQLQSAFRRSNHIRRRRYDRGRAPCTTIDGTDTTCRTSL